MRSTWYNFNTCLKTNGTPNRCTPTQTNQRKITLNKIYLFRLICLNAKKMNNKPTPVSTSASVFFSTSKVATTSAARENPTTRIVDGRPSLYMTIKKEKYTRAKPVSLCIKVNTAGNKTMVAAISRDLVFCN